MDKNKQQEQHDAEKLLYIAALIQSEIERQAMQTWKPGWIAPDLRMTARAARDANVIIHKMIRGGCENT